MTLVNVNNPLTASVGDRRSRNRTNWCKLHPLIKKMRLPKNQCASCPFRQNGLELTSSTMTEICKYLVEGQNHLCHSDRTNQTVCLGGRSYQLDIWYRMGWIEAPTNKALARVMRDSGVEPAEHISSGAEIETEP